MTGITTTLWDLVKEAVVAPLERAQPHAVARRPSIQDRYDALVVEMKHTYGVRVRKWRTSSSGVAWTVRYVDGREVKLVESPYPRGPMSCAIFLHEVGHHVIGLGVFKPRCLEEHRVWLWALQTMGEKGFNVTEAVQRRFERSMRYAVAKARRRGLKQLPTELRRFL